MWLDDALIKEYLDGKKLPLNWGHVTNQTAMQSSQFRTLNNKSAYTGIVHEFYRPIRDGESMTYKVLISSDEVNMIYALVQDSNFDEHINKKFLYFIWMPD